MTALARLFWLLLSSGRHSFRLHSWQDLCGSVVLFWQQSREKSGYKSIWNPLRSAAMKVLRAQESCQQCKLTFLLYIHCNISSVMMQTPCSVALLIIFKRFCYKAQFNIICFTNISKTQSNNFKLIQLFRSNGSGLISNVKWGQGSLENLKRKEENIK